MLILPLKVLTGTLPFGKLSGPEAIFKVVEGDKPSKPANAAELGLSDRVWRLLDECWQSNRALRPLVKEFLDRVKAAASVCGTLSSVGGGVQQYEVPDSDFNKFGRSPPHSSSDEEFIGFCRTIIPRGDLG